MMVSEIRPTSNDAVCAYGLLGCYCHFVLENDSSFSLDYGLIQEGGTNERRNVS